MTRGDEILAALLAAFFLVTLANVANATWQSAAAPVLSASAGLFLCGLLFVRRFRGRKQTETRAQKPVSRIEVETLLYFLACVVLVTLFGFAFGGGAFAALHLRRFAQLKWRTAILSGAALPVVIITIFEGLLHTPLFKGLILASFF